MSRRPRILIIDDTRMQLMWTALALKEYDVVTWDRGLGSGAAILREKPDLVLVDVVMKGIDGDAIVEEFRRAHKACPVMVLHSTLDEPELDRRASACGADGYIRKVNDAKLLVQRVRDFLETRRGDAAGVVAPAAMSTPPPPPPMLAPRLLSPATIAPKATKK